MPAIDQCELNVIRALEKLGWRVTDQPFPIRLSRNEGVYADLRLRSTDGQQSIIVVEVKCFSEKRSILDEFYHAVGQYLLYREALHLKNITVPLYLSVPRTIYDTFFARRMVQAVLKNANIKIMVVDIELEEVIQWIK
ncbi:MAG: hypothetical protein BroJett018_29360 [Chloroflexota bacterium]|nr:MAG: hypothetical protein BroJett018_29360 [Chloroflexota bacterium]